MFTKLKHSFFILLIKLVQKFGPHRVRVLGNTYDVSEDVFNPRYYYTSSYMAKYINVSSGDIVLDMGTGSGIQAITAAKKASKVVAIDINPEAVRFAEKNARASGVNDVVSVVQGDLFSPLSSDQKFSVILFTPPYLAGSIKTTFDHALIDPDKFLLRRFFRDAKSHLLTGGYVQMLYSKMADHESALKISREMGWDHQIIAKEKTLSEEFLIYRLTIKSCSINLFQSERSQ